MVYITGDEHRDFSRYKYFHLYEEDLLIILGDSCINYYRDITDRALKEELKKLKNSFFLVRGNHEERPENIDTYKEVDMFGGKVYIEEEYPNLIFAKDGEIYNIDNTRILVIGGAYSVDKEYRLRNNMPWFPSEQLTLDERSNIYHKVKGEHFDIVLSHTCPLKYEPREVFLKGINEAKVDKTMEKFLDVIEESISYDKWYCGHFHTEKQIDKMEFMFKEVKSFKRGKEYIKFIK